MHAINMFRLPSMIGFYPSLHDCDSILKLFSPVCVPFHILRHPPDVLNNFNVFYKANGDVKYLNTFRPNLLDAGLRDIDLLKDIINDH